ncbi:ATP-binding protein [Cellulomonas sp. NPDC057328]|uniref:ATP-binding protein n=1 Tax=Cellulomonas sp. NPDC057328 TaxID=3346101 RepID=UPI003638A9C7
MPDVRVDVALDGEDAETVLDRAHGALERLWVQVPDVGDMDRIAVETALVEVAGNVVRHGPDGRWHGPGLHVTVGADAVVVVIDQDGLPLSLDPAPAMPGPEAESGRGLPLVHALVDVVCTARPGGTRWTLTRRRSA